MRTNQTIFSPPIRQHRIREQLHDQVTIHSGEAVAEMGGGPTGEEISLVGDVRNTVMRGSENRD
ncbi:MAG: hypothetical protein H7Z17_20765 [Fuerstia sp.]|nr:hypothetical protein [Fuerstiella sp.]